MEDQFPSLEQDSMLSNGHSEAALADRASATSTNRMERHTSIEGLRFAEAEALLLDSEVLIEFKNIKTAMVLPPNHRWPVEVEGLLVERRKMPLCAHAEVTLTVGDREVLREEFYLPTHRREEVMEADRKLAEVSSEILTNETMRNRALQVYYPELSDDYDLWYRVAIDELGVMNYALHVGPTDHQDIKKKIEGTIQL